MLDALAASALKLLRGDREGASATASLLPPATPTSGVPLRPVAGRHRESRDI
jgi:hypothetical protein